MKSFILHLLFLLITIRCFSQTDTTKVPFVSYWSKGDSYNFAVTKIKEQWRGDSLTKRDSFRYIANFKVLDSTETSYTIKWSFETLLASDFKIPPKLVERFAKYNLTEVIYKTNELGIFQGIENWEEISRMMTAMYTDFIEITTEDGTTNKDTLTKALQPFISAHQSKEGVEQLILKELAYFHFPFGVEFSTTESVVYEELLPNLFGGNPVRGQVKLYLDYVDFENYYCVLIKEMHMDPEDTKQMLLEIFKKIGIGFDKMESMLQSAKLEMKDYNRYAYFYDPGIPAEIEAKRDFMIEIEGAKTRTIEMVRIELMD